MTSNQWARLRDGVIGTFQPLVADGLEPAPGMIKLSGEHAEVTFMASEDQPNGGQPPQHCSAVFGATQAGGVLMMSISERSGSRGVPRIARYRSRCLVLNPPAQEIDADTVVAVQLHYYGLTGWSGEPRLSDEPIVEDGAVVGWTAELRWDVGVKVPMPDGFTLCLSPGHTVGGLTIVESCPRPSLSRSNRRDGVRLPSILFDLTPYMLSWRWLIVRRRWLQLAV